MRCLLAYLTPSLLVDLLVLLTYFGLIVGIGLWAGRGNRNLTEFALGGRSIPWWAVLASIIAAETSAVTFLGAPTEGFKTRSFVYGQLAIGTVLARIIIAFTFIKPYYRYGVQSIYEFLEIRFGPCTRTLASSIFLFTRVLGIGVRLYLGGAILKVIWHYLFPGSEVNLTLYFVGILTITLLTTAYTAIGGIRAVVWTDFIQTSLMLGSVALSIVLLLGSIPGGWGEVLHRLGRFPPVVQLGFDPKAGFGTALRQMLEEPYTLAAALIASTFLTMSTHGTDQDMVQRMLTAPNFRKSQLSLILSGLADLPIAGSFLLVGILLWVYYQCLPDPQLPAADNEIFAYYIVSRMPVGVRGLIIAGVFATMMGSTSAALNALATSFTKDFYLPYLRRHASPEASVRAARVATVVFGCFMVGVATLAANAVLRDSKLTILPIALGCLGYTYGALLGIFLVGLLTRGRGRDETNIVAMLTSIAAVLVLGRIKLPLFDVGALLTQGVWQDKQYDFGALMPVWWPTIAFPWYVLIGCVTCIVVSIVFPTPKARRRVATSRRRKPMQEAAGSVGGE
ncbi:MAG: sodium:solute symporter [Verrucomicrobia bacterium]|nr:sodium:solute symporter [Verrucomicrobiota bacterium]